ncbi:MAG: M20/M25/M40 family metallo-hydrolase [Actinomycetota bacterium]|nr:M20/M25/M40 family metallo-hydrolase [Actinomycetota bacterium]
MKDLVASGAGIASIVEERFPTYLERIRDLCRMPSVSATGEGVRQTADAVAGLIEEAGGSARLVETAGHPVVLGELSGPPGAPRLVRYGMYDVQPAEEPDWSAPPFGAEIVERPGVGPVVLGRGTANSKGSLAAFFCALDALRSAGGVPVGVAFFIEGEEELGSPHLEDVVRAHADELAGDAGVDFDLFGDLAGGADLVFGCKGLLGLEVSCTSGDWGGPARPLHSSEAAWIASPVWSLIHALAELTGPGEELLVPGLDANARPPTEADRALLQELADGFDPAEHLIEAGAARYKLPGGAAELLEALIFRPTMNVSGLEAGYTGPGGKTILPHRARALLDIRLVPDLDALEVTGVIRDHLRAGGHAHVEVEVLDHYPWAKSDPRSAVAGAMRASYERLGRRVLPYPMAPWCAPFHVFDRVLGIPWASGGLGHSGGAHGPDEFASVDGLKEHILGVAEFLTAFSETGT